MSGSAWHYATHLLAPRSFHSAAGGNGGRQAAEGRSRGQVGVSVTPHPREPVTTSKSDRPYFQPDVLFPAQEFRRHTNNPSSCPAVHSLPAPWGPGVVPCNSAPGCPYS